MKKIIAIITSVFILCKSLIGLDDNRYIENTYTETKQETTTDSENTVIEIEVTCVDPVKMTIPVKTEEEIQIEEYETKIAEIKNIEDTKEWFLDYKEINFKYVNWIDPPETVFDVFTEEEVRLICRAVETECYQQNFDSKVNVASVIFNRIESGKFGDTVNEVITSPNQFDYGRKNLSEDTILAVQYAFEIEDTTDGCIAFRSGKLPEKWYTWGDNYWTRIFVDDAGHGFYK